MIEPKRCPRCKSAFDELCARDPMPAEYEPRRCECLALLSYRVPVEGEPGVYERRKVER